MRVLAAACVLIGCNTAGAAQHAQQPQSAQQAQRAQHDGAPLEVTFGGQGFHVVEMDGYGVARGAHWPVRAELPAVSPDLPDYYRKRGSPVSWVRGAAPEAVIEARVPAAWQGDVHVTGSSDALTFSGTGTASDGRLRAVVRSEHALPDEIAVFDSLAIHWSAAHGGDVRALGATTNPMYVLFGPPTAPLLHTPLHISSTRAAGMSDTAAIVAAVWSEFADREVRRARDGLALRYYGLLNDKAPAELRGFLISGTGQCVAWSYFLYAALGSHGIPSEIIMVSPPQLGRIYVGRWGFAEGRHFVDAGPNGVVETAAAGDDVSYFPVGTSVPGAPVFHAEPIEPVRLEGDDEWLPRDCETCVGGFYMSGPNGLVDTKLDPARAVPVIARGFGLENQRVYQLLEGTDPASIQLGGDDEIARHIKITYVMSGPNGILETPRQPGMRDGRATGSRWDPVLGQGPTSIRFPTAIPLPHPLPPVAGDDLDRGWWLDSGEDGVSQTPGAHIGTGTPFVIGIGAGGNGRIDSRPAGDDRVVDLSEFLELAPAEHDYVSFRNTWPLRDEGGQSNPRPPTDYPNHVIVQVGERYYDPSYGTGPFDSQLAWEQASLAGVGQRMKRDGEFVMFNGRIQMVTRRFDGTRTLTSFGTMLPPD